MMEPVNQAFHNPSKEELTSSLYMNWVGHRHCEAAHVVGPRVLDTYKIVFVVNGTGYLSQDQLCEHQLSTGDMFVLFPQVRHYYHAQPDNPWELMWVSISGSICNLLLQQMGINRNRSHIHNVTNEFIERKIIDIIQTINDNDPLHLYSMGNLYLLLSSLNQTLQESKPSITSHVRSQITRLAIAYIEQNYHDDQLDVDKICQHINFSRSYLSRTFRNDTGYTIPEYTNDMRIQKAKLLIHQTDLSIQDIAASVGICDSSYFSKLFKRKTGFSPLEYKNIK